MDNLTNKWKEARKAIAPPSQTAEQLISLANAKKKDILYFHYGNVAILGITFICLCLFFYYVAPLKHLLSKIGICFMLCGLLIRIVIEIFSTLKSKKIKLVNDIAKTAGDTLMFYNFRKTIHGPVTITIVVFYIIGFYLLSPEFSKYFSLPWMIAMDTSFIIGAIILIWQIRKGIKKEIGNLASLIELKNEMSKQNDAS